MTEPTNPLAALIEAARSVCAYADAISDGGDMIDHKQLALWIIELRGCLAALPANAGECVLVPRALLMATLDDLQNFAEQAARNACAKQNQSEERWEEYMPESWHRLRAAAGVGKV